MLNFAILLLFTIGIGFIIYSVIKFKPVDQKGADTLTQETLERLEASIEEADNAMEEISKLSQSIFDEMTEKYKELLYLYSALENKKSVSEPVVDKAALKMPEQSFANSNFRHTEEEQRASPIIQTKTTTAVDMPENSFMDMFNSENPKHQEIRALHQKGHSVADIAKQLNLGQSEVSLVVQLGRGR